MNKNYKSLKNDDIDVCFIIHKNEGRLFLLGRNGYYNKLIEDIYPKLRMNVNYLDGKISFVLISSNENDRKLVENLTEKGDQKGLKIFENSNKFIIMNENEFESFLENEKSTKIKDFCTQTIDRIGENEYILKWTEYEENIAKYQEIVEKDKFLLLRKGKSLDDQTINSIINFTNNRDESKINKLCFIL